MTPAKPVNRVRWRNFEVRLRNLFQARLIDKNTLRKLFKAPQVHFWQEDQQDR